MYILHQEGSFFYCPFFTDLFKNLCRFFDKSGTQHPTKNHCIINSLLTTKNRRAQRLSHTITFNYSALSPFSARFATSAARMRLCSLSGNAYLRVGIAESSMPIAGGIEIRKNIAAAYLPSL